ncbi:unnamed protein product [Phyllotreta striolata]|uniref:Transforming growth factor beta regulator 1 n=1 Tax=Phyllotreta striolata TaxID=444603 RepID=A0A9N9XRE7_PHYSR|nr:unnamed protein product [Phyllotreta striolata]
MNYDYNNSNFRRKNFTQRGKFDKSPGKYKQKVMLLKQMIREYVHENAALIDELEEVQINTIIRKEERKFLLRKLCEYEPQVALEVQNAAKESFPQSNSVSGTPTDPKKPRRKGHTEKRPSSRKSSSKSRKKIVQPIPVDHNGKPVFPIELGRLTVHSLGEVVHNKPDFHTEFSIYPAGYVSTRVYGSLQDPTQKCIYTCKISNANDMPRFEIASDDWNPPITGDTPDVCHSLLLQRINDSLSLNVVSTRPRGHDFFGLTHPTVQHLIQNSNGARRCSNYKWIKFEVSREASRNSQAYADDNDAGLSYEYLQRSINYCKYKMAPDVLQRPEDFVDSKDNLVLF